MGAELAEFQHPRFVRMYERVNAESDKRGTTAHCDRVLAGLSGRVLEPGAPVMGSTQSLSRHRCRSGGRGARRLPARAVGTCRCARCSAGAGGGRPRHGAPVRGHQLRCSRGVIGVVLGTRRARCARSYGECSSPTANCGSSNMSAPRRRFSGCSRTP
jgi:hypothetical protein